MLKKIFILSTMVFLGTAAAAYAFFSQPNYLPEAAIAAAEKVPITSVLNYNPPVEPNPYTKNLNELMVILNQQDPRAALQELARRMQTDPYVFKNCHSMAHELGHATYKKYGDFTTALKYADTTCSDGFLHGVIEGKFANSTDIFADLKKTCVGALGDSGRCYHGVGHGVMFYTENDLPKSLAICDTYSGMPRGRCDEGVFMENFLSDDKAHISKYVDPKNPEYPCTEQPGRFKPFCYFYAPIYYLSHNNDDYQSAVQWCQTKIAKTGTTSCVRGVGSLAMKYNISNPKIAEQVCLATSGDQSGNCIDGLTSYFLTYFGHLKLANTMCATLLPQNQDACFRAVQRRAQIYSE